MRPCGIWWVRWPIRFRECAAGLWQGFVISVPSVVSGEKVEMPLDKNMRPFVMPINWRSHSLVGGGAEVASGLKDDLGYRSA